MNFITKIRMILSVVLAVLVMKIAKELMILAKLVGMAILVIKVNAVLESFAKTKVSHELVTRDFRYPKKEVERYKVLQGTKATHTDAEKVEYNHLIDDFIELRSRPEKVHQDNFIELRSRSEKVLFVVKKPKKVKKDLRSRPEKVHYGIKTPLLTRYLVLYKNRANHTDEEKAEYKQLFHYWRNARFFSGVLADA